MKYLVEFGLIAAALISVAGVVRSDSDTWFKNTRTAPQSAEYRAECGSCHMAYPPSLLPAAAWENIMSALDDHFGDNAELPAAAAARIREHLLANSAQPNKRFRRDSHTGTTPRITELPYIRRQHAGIPARLIQGNPDVGSLSNCQACHRRAEAGSFDEHSVNIPGYGRWDD